MSDNDKVKKERKKMMILKSCFIGFMIACFLCIVFVFVLNLIWD